MRRGSRRGRAVGTPPAGPSRRSASAIEGTRPASVHRIVIPTPFAEGHVNAYLLPGDPLTLVDCGTDRPEAQAALADGLHTAGVELGDLEQVVLTHLHWDHHGNLAAVLAAAPGIAVVAHRSGEAGLCGGAAEGARQEAFLLDFLRTAGVAEADLALWAGRRPEPTFTLTPGRVRWVEDGNRVQAGGAAWEVLYTPGHSQTEICLFDPASGDLMASDHLLPDISANAFVEAPPPGIPGRPRTLLQYREHLARARALPADMVYPGHGAPFRGHRALIDRRFAEQEERCARIAEALGTGPLTALEVSAALFPHLRGRGVYLGISEVVGHLDLMGSRGRVAVDPDGGVDRYRLT